MVAGQDDVADRQPRHLAGDRGSDVLEARTVLVGREVALQLQVRNGDGGRAVVDDHGPDLDALVLGLAATTASDDGVRDDGAVSEPEAAQVDDPGRGDVTGRGTHQVLRGGDADDRRDALLVGADDLVAVGHARSGRAVLERRRDVRHVGDHDAVADHLERVGEVRLAAGDALPAQRDAVVDHLRRQRGDAFALPGSERRGGEGVGAQGQADGERRGQDEKALHQVLRGVDGVARSFRHRYADPCRQASPRTPCRGGRGGDRTPDHSLVRRTLYR